MSSRSDTPKPTPLDYISVNRRGFVVSLMTHLFAPVTIITGRGEDMVTVEQKRLKSVEGEREPAALGARRTPKRVIAPRSGRTASHALPDFAPS